MIKIPLSVTFTYDPVERSWTDWIDGWPGWNTNKFNCRLVVLWLFRVKVQREIEETKGICPNFSIICCGNPITVRMTLPLLLLVNGDECENVTLLIGLRMVVVNR